MNEVESLLAAADQLAESNPTAQALLLKAAAEIIKKQNASETIVSLVKADQIIAAIKRLRHETGMSLAEAKEIVDKMRAEG